MMDKYEKTSGSDLEDHKEILKRGVSYIAEQEHIVYP